MDANEEAARPTPPLPPDSGRFVSPEDEASNVAVVRDFLAAFEGPDLKRMSELLAEDVAFRLSQKHPPQIGKAKVLEALKGFFDLWTFEFKTWRIVALGPVVVTERDDFIRDKTGQTSLIKIAGGMFFIEAGKIVEWTDYMVE